MNSSQPKLLPALIEISVLLLVVGAVAYGVFAVQQKKVERLHAENQSLKQQIANLQSTNTEQQRAIAGLTQAANELKVNLQTVCQESQSSLLARLENGLDNLLEHDFTVQWKQICQNPQIATNSQP
jgi:uncharacterized protein HemX